MNFKSLVINLSFFMIWALSLVLVYKENYAVSESARLNHLRTISSPEIDTQKWFNVTINGQKIGYNMNSYSKTELGYVFKNYSLLRMPMAGVVREVLIDCYAVVDDDFSLKAFTFGITSGDYSTDIFGNVAANKLHLKVQTGGNSSEVVIPVIDGIYMPGVIPLLISAKGFPKGEYTLPGFDPISLMDSDIKVIVEDKNNIKVNGEKYNACKILINMSGASSTMWVIDDGTVVMEEETAGMKMTLTSREDALNLPEINPDWDILKALAVSVDKKLDNPRDALYMKTELTGIEIAGFNLNDDYQRIVSIDPLILEIGAMGFELTERNEGNAGQLSRYIKPEPFIQSDDPRIISQSKSIVKDLEDDSLKVSALVDWVFKHIAKDYAISVPSAVDVLRIRRGDCNEHTALFTALARAAGIPAKVCMGVVYSDSMFFYHAWSAVHLRGRWQAVDPTFGQYYADATHIKLLEGGFDTQTNLMRVVGKLKVKILEYSTSPDLAFNK